eukprot:ANDGO_03240.mRNA.1 Ring canal kelch protein
MNISTRPTFYDADNAPKYHKRTNAVLQPAKTSPSSGAGSGSVSPSSPNGNSVSSPRKEAYFARGFGEHLKNPDLADVMLQLQANAAETLKAHTLILAFGSEYFREYFSSAKWKDRTSNNLLLSFDHPCPLSILTQVLEFLYEGTVDIHHDNAVALLRLSKTLGIPTLQSACLNFLESQITLEKVLHIASEAGAGKWAETNVEQQCMEMITESFDALCSYGMGPFDDFSELAEAQLIALLQQDALVVESESTVVFLINSYCRDKKVNGGSLWPLVRWCFVEPQAVLEVWRFRQETGLTLDFLTYPMIARLVASEYGELEAFSTTSIAKELPETVSNMTRPRGTTGSLISQIPGYALWRIPKFAELDHIRQHYSVPFADKSGTLFRIVLSATSSSGDGAVSVYVELTRRAVSRISENAPDARVWKVPRIIRVTVLNDSNAAGSVSRASSKNFVPDSVRFGWPSFMPMAHVPDFEDETGALTVCVHITEASRLDVASPVPGSQSPSLFQPSAS